MYKISNSIRQYYLDHFDELDTRAQFHFASHLHLWSSDPELDQHLQRLAPDFTNDGDVSHLLESLVAKSAKSKTFGAFT